MNWILILLLAFLHLVAAISGIKEYKSSAIVMLTGSLLIIINVILCFVHIYNNLFFIYLGSMLIICSAIYNGKRTSIPHLSHHIVRISLFIIASLLI